VNQLDVAQLDKFASDHSLSIEAQAAEALKSLPQIYYAGRQGFWLQDGRGFIPLPRESQVSQHLKVLGIEKELIGPILCRIRLRHYVSFAGAVAGHDSGVHLSPDSGKQFLVTDPPRIIRARKGRFDFIQRFLSELLGEDIQKEAFTAFLRQARQNLKKGERRPLPVAALVGPKSCGKTLCGEIVRRVLGGRVANAMAALCGETFNADTLGAELLLVDDEIASRDPRTRLAFAQGIKKRLFATSVQFRPLYHEGIQMRPIQAVVIAVNDEPEHLQVLPAIDDTTRDKISLFSCSKANLDGLEDRMEISKRIDKELPGFLHFLESTSHPPELRDPRTGAKSWQHQEVLAQLESIAPEQKLRELLLICTDVTDDIANSGFWRGTAADLQSLLTASYSPRAHVAKGLFSYNTACGTYLARLAKSKDCDITSVVSNGITKWIIAKL
jgi:hypothetical protein